MNIALTSHGNPVDIAALRVRNDRFRRTLTGGSLMLSAGVVALGAANQARIIAAALGFAGFDTDFEIGDPFDDHSIGDFEVEVEEPGIHRWPELIFFRIDSLGTGLTLTIMLATEW